MLFKRKTTLVSTPEPPQNIRTWDHPTDFEEFVILPNLTQTSTSSSGTSSLLPDKVPLSSQSTLLTHLSSTAALSPSDEIIDSTRASGSKSLRSPVGLLTLPAELIPHIAMHLPYPDIVALRHTHPHFLHTSLLSSSKPLKVEWLIARGLAGLPIPRNRSTRWDSDAAFLNNSEVRSIMIARRRHAECGAGPGGCTVVTGSTCGGRRVHWQGSFLGINLIRYEGEKQRVLIRRFFHTIASGEGWTWEVVWGLFSLGALAVSIWLSIGYVFG